MRAFLSLILCGLLSVATASPSGIPTVGEPAPEFSAQNTQGNKVSLKDYRGKFVVLEWTNYGCPFVQKHYNSNNMQNLQKKYTDKGVVWLTIVSSAPGKQGYYRSNELEKISAEKGNQATTIIPDPSGKIGRKYDAKTTPHMFIVAPDGKLIYKGAIDSIKSTNVDDIPRAVNYVSQSLDAAMNGKHVPTSQTAPYGCSVKY